MTREDLEKLKLLATEKQPGGEFTLKRTYWQLGHADTLKGAGFVFGDNASLAILLAAAPALALACLKAHGLLRILAADLTLTAKTEADGKVVKVLNDVLARTPGELLAALKLAAVEVSGP